MRYKAIAALTISLFLATGASASNENIINNFSGPNGVNPAGSVILDSSGNIYGTTYVGGDHGAGTVYQLKNTGGDWSESVLYNFTRGNDGGNPETGALVVDSSGSLYGTTAYGGAHNYGVVFKLTNSGGIWTETVLHTFTGRVDGGNPVAGLIESEGSFYGTTYYGGRFGYGNVFELKKSKGSWKETVLYSFCARQHCADGANPSAPVTPDSSGNLYGGTTFGGEGWNGVIFKLTRPSKGGAWKEAILYKFHRNSGGSNPNGVLLDAPDNLYVAAGSGGEYDAGSIVQLKRSGEKYEENVIFTFNGSNGAYALGPLAMDSAGNLYGSAHAGGLYSVGVVFELSYGTWTFTDLHDFDDNGTDGYTPFSGVALDSSGIIYGTAYYGGTSRDGIVYQITP